MKIRSSIVSIGLKKPLGNADENLDLIIRKGVSKCILMKSESVQLSYI